MIGHGGHLARRFAGSWSRRMPPADDLEWARAHLLTGEWELWCRLGPADRRHAVLVARRTIAAVGVGSPDGGERPLVAGALLHDIGKLDAGLGPMGRVMATLWRAGRGPAAERGTGRISRYLRHEPIGAAWCAAAGSDPRTVALVGRTEGASSTWSAALRAADDSI